MKVIKRIIIFITLVLIFAGALLTYQGYNMYKEALEQISVKDKVEDLRCQKNYTEFKQRKPIFRQLP